MKILHILTDDEPVTHGEKLITELHRAGLRQSVICPCQSPAFALLQRQGLRVVATPVFYGCKPLEKFLLRRIVAREKPDVIQTWTPRAAQNTGAQKKHKLVGWVGGYHDTQKFAHAHHLIAVTQDILAHLDKKGGAKQPASFIPSFPDIAALPPIDRATLATPRHAKVLLSLSRLHPQKGLDTLIDALQNMPECIVWLAGEGPLRRALENQAQKNNVLDRVRFLGKRSDAAALLRAADLCVVPSRVEPFGAVILEAWAAGTPVVASNCAGIAAQIDADTTGVLVPVNDPQALASAIRRVLGDEPLRRRLVSQGYAAYIKDYTREAVVRQWTTFYKKMTA